MCSRKEMDTSRPPLLLRRKTRHCLRVLHWPRRLWILPCPCFQTFRHRKAIIPLTSTSLRLKRSLSTCWTLIIHPHLALTNLLPQRHQQLLAMKGDPQISLSPDSPHLLCAFRFHTSAWRSEYYRSLLLCSGIYAEVEVYVSHMGKHGVVR